MIINNYELIKDNTDSNNLVKSCTMQIDGILMDCQGMVQDIQEFLWNFAGRFSVLLLIPENGISWYWFMNFLTDDAGDECYSLTAEKIDQMDPYVIQEYFTVANTEFNDDRYTCSVIIDVKKLAEDAFAEVWADYQASLKGA